MLNKSKHVNIILIYILVVNVLSAQTFVPNYDESKVPSFKLPKILRLKNGEEVKSREVWENERRPEILELFEAYMFGKAPGKPENISFKVIALNNDALDGKATRKEVIISISGNEQTVNINLLIYLPNNGNKKHPLFVGLNFYGNHSIHSDPNISLSTNWMKKNDAFGVVNNRATEASRGVRYSRWPVEYILERGYGLATIYDGDIDPDFDDGFQNGVHPLFYKDEQIYPKQDEWATIAAWAWGLSRVMDYFEVDDSIDKERVSVMGHSRLGKASLWAGATDERFSLVVSNSSGSCGAALSRRRFGETIGKLNSDFPHWFCENFDNYINNENELPLDQHMLVTLIAPRPVYIASAEEDLWADPRGEFLSGKYAGSVYELFGKNGLDKKDMPEINNPIMNSIGYHIRSGKHDVTMFDWKQFIDFADKHFGNAK